VGGFGHGELAGVVHPLGLVDQRGSHLRFASAGAAADACGGKPGLGAFFDERRFVFGHQREHAEDEFAVRGGGVHDAVGQ
jgi:hypothetical protein